MLIEKVDDLSCGSVVVVVPCGVQSHERPGTLVAAIWHDVISMVVRAVNSVSSSFSACNCMVAFSVDLIKTLTGPKMIAEYGVSMWMMRRASKKYFENWGPLVLSSLLNIKI